MTDFTRKEIRRTFLGLLEKKPIEDITVRDIANGCGINRNTFYYHYTDIPSLLEEIVREDADMIIEGDGSSRTIESCLEEAINFAIRHKSAVKNIYASSKRSIFEQYLWRVCKAVVSSYLDSLDDTSRLSKEERKMIIEYLKAILYGLVSLWLESGMDEKILLELHAIARLKSGDLEAMIRKATNK